MLDTSGSMFGEKINHAVDALKNIITALPEGDNFNLIRYGNKVRTWRSTMVSAEEKIKAKAVRSAPLVHTTLSIVFYYLLWVSRVLFLIDPKVFPKKKLTY